MNAEQKRCPMPSKIVCDQEGCAWWVNVCGACAVTALAQAFSEAGSGSSFWYDDLFGAEDIDQFDMMLSGRNNTPQ